MKIGNRILLSLVLTLFLVSGCTTLDPYTDTPQPSHTSVGAGVGAIGGALLSAITGHSSHGVLIGAGLGALAGSAIGNAVDREEAMLRERLRCTGVRVLRDGPCIRLVMPCDITFANDCAMINPSFYPTLDSIAVVLKRFNHTLVKIAGYTSNTGTLMHNQLLSENRAHSVAQYLTVACVNPNRLVTIGYGVRFPVADNCTEYGRALNRRVEITLRPLDECGTCQ